MYKLGIRSCVPDVLILLNLVSNSIIFSSIPAHVYSLTPLVSRIHVSPVDKTEENIGSFAPRLEAYEHTFDEETAPEGWLARGDYKAKTKVFSSAAESISASILLVHSSTFSFSLYSGAFSFNQLVDDDGKVHLEVEYAIEIAKEF